MLDLRRVSTEVRDEVIATLGGIILERFTIVMLLDDDEGRYEKIMNECNIIDALNYAVYNIPGALEALHLVAREVVEEYKSA